MFCPFPRNTTPSIFQKCVTLLNGILQQVMLHFYTSFNILFQQSTASIQGLFLKLILTFPLGTTASIEAFYFKAGCIFLKECRTVFKECITLFAMEHCKKVMLHYNSFLNILFAVSNEYCIG